MEASMALDRIHSWTLGDLIVSFVELAVAYFLLCTLAFAFFASKFLNVLGIHLPCPCIGFLGYQNRDLCWHRLLIDWPRRTICSVQVLVNSRLPCNSVWVQDQACYRDVGLLKDAKLDNPAHEFRSEACSTSFSGLRLQDLADKEIGHDAKGKRITNPKQRSGTRWRRRGVLGNGKFPSVLVADNAHTVVAGVSSNMYDGSKMRSESFNPDGGIEDGARDEANARNGLDTIFPVDKLACSPQDNVGMAETHLHTIRMLEVALQEEKSAHAAVCLELEEERAAAASAADEAMAMILRLQKDKASIEMEARQYQRIIEEKFAYDEVEMDILKEILISKERENHFLEKELEAYHLMNVSRNELLESNLSYQTNEGGEGASISAYQNEDPEHTEINKSTGEEEVIKTASWSSNYGKGLPDVGEKLISKNKNLHSDLSLSQGLVKMSETDSDLYQFIPRGHNLLENTTDLTGNTANAAQICSGIVGLEKDGEHGNQADSDLGSMFNREPSVYDVHVIDDKPVFQKADEGKQSGPSNSGTSDTEVRCYRTLKACPDMRMSEIEYNIQESSLEMRCRLQMLGDRSKPLCCDAGRTSLSPDNSARLKIDSEVEWLRERLRQVKEEKDKLTFAAEQKQRVATQLQLIEELLNHFRQIQELREPVRQASFTPSSSKMSLKKRRCRSVSSEALESA
ncbi:hypothetical protein HS088_TW10G00261 [Tripterygium wilfordii]|uniref:GTD-binding domain-containing protein n=1 Tax=Tripterygium wilfordii TaxID=458696 RepID=A0A7J7D4J1_TRIWF|nr:uncharacterized protein LOC120007534 [Tripterygium wilfordii]XP_038713746.1 uncharacterized protein LOC120007534 [Tripterygium wilfordii]XP_038713747.1 uncharacterized protein LOC120007534 [Tripterygium wilfordii]KAF5741265.1 hypothetical protein HS088_TW10G00261 [Tripterygium wilfordii]